MGNRFCISFFYYVYTNCMYTSPAHRHRSAHHPFYSTSHSESIFKLKIGCIVFIVIIRYCVCAGPELWNFKFQPIGRSTVHMFIYSMLQCFLFKLKSINHFQKFFMLSHILLAILRVCARQLLPIWWWYWIRSSWKSTDEERQTWRAKWCTSAVSSLFFLFPPFQFNLDS